MKPWVRIGLLVGTLSSASSAQPTFADHGVRLTIPSRSFDTLQVVKAVWGVGIDGRYKADAYRVTWRISTDAAWSREVVVTSASASVTVPLPPYPLDSVALYATVRGSRKGVKGTDSVYAVRWLKRAYTGALPPRPVDSMPDGYRVLAVYSWQFKRPPLELDSIKRAQLDTASTAAIRFRIETIFQNIAAEPDSIYLSQPLPGGVEPVTVYMMHSVPLCYLGQNKYTGLYAILDGDVNRCISVLNAWKTRRST